MQRLRFEMRSSFPLGEMVITQGAMSELTQADVLKAFMRHTRGDWGDLCDEDKQENAFSLQHGFRLLSRYHADNGTAFYVITEHDRSKTTVLLTTEY